MTILPLTFIALCISTSSSSFISNSSLQIILDNHLTESGICQYEYPSSFSFVSKLFFCLMKQEDFILTVWLELTWGMISGRFGSPPWTNASELVSTSRRGRQLGDDGPRLWPGARVPYEFSNTIDFREWQIMQHVFSNISSVTNIQFVPRSVKIVIDIIYC